MISTTFDCKDVNYFQRYNIEVCTIHTQNDNSIAERKKGIEFHSICQYEPCLASLRSFVPISISIQKKINWIHLIFFLPFCSFLFLSMSLSFYVIHHRHLKQARIANVSFFLLQHSIMWSTSSALYQCIRITYVDDSFFCLDSVNIRFDVWKKSAIQMFLFHWIRTFWCVQNIQWFLLLGSFPFPILLISLFSATVCTYFCVFVTIRFSYTTSYWWRHIRCILAQRDCSCHFKCDYVHIHQRKEKQQKRRTRRGKKTADLHKVLVNNRI